MASFPTEGFVALQRNNGMPDINPQYLVSGLVPDILQAGQGFTQFASELPAQYREEFSSLSPLLGPTGAFQQVLIDLSNDPNHSG